MKQYHDSTTDIHSANNKPIIRINHFEQHNNRRGSFVTLLSIYSTLFVELAFFVVEQSFTNI
jgi:hypothetical protein